MSLIKLTNLTFGYDGSTENVFEQVNLQMDTAWRMGLTGRNGRGKTTLLRILMGELQYTGNVTASVEFEYFPYQPQEDAMTLDVLTALAPNAEDWEFCRELSLLETDAEVLYRPFSTLSGGEQTKVLLAGMFLRENGFLLIDEPTNHLDVHAREVLAAYLRKKSGFLLISHDRAFLDTCIDHILVIQKTKIAVQNGNFSTWDENRIRQEQFEQTTQARLNREIHALQQTAKENAEHSARIAASKIGFDPNKTEKSISRRPSIARKSKKLDNRRQVFEQRLERDIEEKSSLLQDVEMAESLKLHPLRYHSNRLLECSKISLAYNDRAILDSFSLTVAQGERIAIEGTNGCGKTTLLRILCGELETQSGEVLRGSGLQISYVGQRIDGLSGWLDDYIEASGAEMSLFKAILRKLDFSRELFTRRMEDYSQGQKKKVMLARSLSEQAHLYIWDEPLNYIDVLSRMQIEELLVHSDATILFVEHDRRFCDTVATRTISL